MKILSETEIQLLRLLEDKTSIDIRSYDDVNDNTIYFFQHYRGNWLEDILAKYHMNSMTAEDFFDILSDLREKGYTEYDDEEISEDEWSFDWKLTQKGIDFVNTNDNLPVLLKQPESNILNFLSSNVTISEISIAIVALANTDGGTIVIGVKDNGQVIGVHDTHGMINTIIEAVSQVKPIIDINVEIF